MLGDGSYLGRSDAGTPVRVIGYTQKDEGVHPHDAALLATNVLQVSQAPALDLVTLLHLTMVRAQHHRAALHPWHACMLRSKGQELVIQDLWGLVLAEHVLRRLGGAAILPA